ncbi:MAG: hypothetical protein Q4B84_02195 [Clostridia bacterium]|nr:hypothetical protein [Clostridia bacterium]
MSNNKKFLKRTVAAFLAAVNIFNFAGGSGKAILYHPDNELSLSDTLKQSLASISKSNLDELILQEIEYNNPSKYVYEYIDGIEDKIIYFLKINDKCDLINSHTLLSYPPHGICIYEIEEGTNQLIVSALMEEFSKNQKVLFIDINYLNEYISNNCTISEKKEKSESEKTILNFFQEIFCLMNPKDELGNFNNIDNFSTLALKIKNYNLKDIFKELIKKSDKFIAISNVLKDLVGILKIEKDNYRNHPEQQLENYMLVNGLQYKDTTFKLSELSEKTDFLGDVYFTYDHDNSFSINSLIDDLSKINEKNIKKLKCIKLEELITNNKIDNEKYCEKIDEYIETLNKIINSISIYEETEKLKNNVRELETKNMILENQSCTLFNDNKKLKEENIKVNNSNKKLLFATVSGWVLAFCGLGRYIFRNSSKKTYDKTYKKFHG